MGSLVNFEGLKKDPALSQTEILTPDTPGYKESIVRWSDTCEKEAVSNSSVKLSKSSKTRRDSHML